MPVHLTSSEDSGTAGEIPAFLETHVPYSFGLIGNIMNSHRKLESKR